MENLNAVVNEHLDILIDRTLFVPRKQQGKESGIYQWENCIFSLWAAQIAQMVEHW